VRSGKRSAAEGRCRELSNVCRDLSVIVDVVVADWKQPIRAGDRNFVMRNRMKKKESMKQMLLV